MALSSDDEAVALMPTTSCTPQNLGKYGLVTAVTAKSNPGGEQVVCGSQTVDEVSNLIEFLLHLNLRDIVGIQLRFLHRWQGVYMS